VCSSDLSVEVLNKAGINSQEASALIIITQHYDTLHSMTENTNSNLIMLPNSPTAGADLMQQMLTALEATKYSDEKQ
jgi:hypothetical protein